jgi:hypothetical protein
MTEPPQKKQKVAVSQHVADRERLHGWLMDHHPLPEVVSRIVFEYWIWDVIRLKELVVVSSCLKIVGEWPHRRAVPMTDDEVNTHFTTTRRLLYNSTDSFCPVCGHDPVFSANCRICTWYDGTKPWIFGKGYTISQSCLTRYIRELDKVSTFRLKRKVAVHHHQ